MQKIGKWAFVLGTLVSVLSGFVSWDLTVIVLIALGLIVGFLNISEKEAEKFLIAAISLLIIGTASFSVILLNGSAGTTQAILNNFVSFVSAAALVVALKTVLTLGENLDQKK